MNEKEKQEILEEYQNFKQIITKNINLEFNEINKFFYIKNNFLARESLYFEEQSFEILLQIIGTSIKNSLSHLEYYTNIRPNNSQALTSDYEIVKEKKDILKLFLKFHGLYKKYNLIFLEHKSNDKKSVSEFLEEIFPLTKQYYKLASKYEKKLSENAMKKIEEMDKKETKFESSVFN